MQVRLEQIFSPSVRLMNRLRYAAKFLVIGAMLLIPIGYSVRLQYGSTTHDVEFNAKERLGVEYIGPTRDLLAAVQKHRVLQVAALQGDASARSDLAKLDTELPALLDRLDAVDGRLGGPLQTTERWKSIRGAWTSLLDRPPTTARDADKAHDEVSNGLIDLILNYAGNYSNLILDPDLDSYWLMDAWCTKMPLLGEYASELATHALLSDPDPRQRQLGVAGSYQALTSMAGDLVTINIATAVKENKSKTLGVLEAPSEQMRKDIQAYADQVKQDALGAEVTTGLPVDAVTRTVHGALGAIDSSYQVYRAIGPHLDGLCAARVAGYASDRRSGVVAGLAAVGVLGYLFAGFFFSVRGSLATLGEATRRMIGGTTDIFTLPSRDEIGDLAGAYNQINQALVEARTLRARVEADSAETNRNIVELLDVVSRASDGDLTVRASVGAGTLGNVADAFNQLLESLGNLVGAIEQQLDRTTATVQQIRAASTDMERGASRQADELKSAAALVELMTRKMGEVNDIATTASDAAKRTKESAEAGSAAVQNVVSGMEHLRLNVQAGAKKMKNLGDRSMEITTIVNTIQRISEQTNMLALNAAIEAARAGEHGRGFTVVADEVRKLAERTALATQEIDKLVKAIHVETDETVHAIEEQTQVVEEEAQIVVTAGDSLTHILDVSNESFAFVANIRDLASQQLDGTRRVAQTMSQISSVSMATQAGARDTTTTIAQLIELSGKLKEAVTRFKVA